MGGFIWWDPEGEKHAKLVARLNAQQAEIDELRSKLDTALSMIELFAEHAGVNAREVLKEAAEWQ